MDKDGSSGSSGVIIKKYALLETRFGLSASINDIAFIIWEGNMKNRYIMTAFGKDRPGIVADVTKILFDNGCNLEENSMSMLGDEFTLNLLFSTTQNNIEKLLHNQCQQLEKEKEITAFIRPLETRREIPVGGVHNCVLHVEGLDQAGIVYKISQFLADNRLNIADLQSTVELSPESGSALYIMDIHVQIPYGADMELIESGLSDVSDELHVEISID
jgi:glycine cleavage system transcriptional repressor